MKKYIIILITLLFISNSFALTTDRQNGRKGFSPFIGKFTGETDPIIDTLRLNSFAYSDTKDTWTKIPNSILDSEFVRTFNVDSKKIESDVTYTFELTTKSEVWIAVPPTTVENKLAFSKYLFKDTNEFLILNNKIQFNIYSTTLEPGKYTLGAYNTGKYFY